MIRANFITFLLLIGISSLAAQDSRRPMPSEAERAQVAAAARDVFQSVIEKAKTPAQKLDVARGLIADGEKSPSFVERYVLLEAARDLAAKAGGAIVGFQAAELLDKHFKTEAGALKEAVYLDAIKAPISKEDGEALLNATPAVLKSAVERDDYKSADRIAQGALAAAKRAKSPALINRATATTRQIDAAAKAYDRVKPALKTLETDPTNAEANFTVGRFQAFYKGDWDHGIPLLALGGDPELRDAASRELNDVIDTKAVLPLAEAWWAAAEKAQGAERDALRLRAGLWYEAAVNDLPEGLNKTKIRKRLEEIVALGRPLPLPPLTQVAQGAVIKPGTAANILPWMEWTQNRKNVGWTKLASNEWHCREGWQHRSLMAPATSDGGYDLLVVFTLGKGNLLLVVPIGPNDGVHVDIGSDIMGLEMVDNKRYFEGGVNVKFPAGESITGVTSRLLISVRSNGPKAVIDTMLDGKPMIHWEGDANRLRGWGPRSPGISLGSWGAEVTFHQAIIRPVSGTATRVPGEL